MQTLLQLHKFLHFTVEQSGDRYAAPFRDDRCDLLIADLFVQHRSVTLELLKF